MFKQFLPLASLVIFSLAVFFSMPIYGEFSLNDDFLYFDAVRDFSLNGEYNPLNYTSILLSQIIIGSVFSPFLGLSMVSMRILTIIFAVLSVILVFFIFKKNGFSEKESFLISALFLFNPLFLNMSVTFLSDIYFTFFTIIGFYYFKEHEKNKRPVLFFIAGIFFLAALFVRQWAITMVGVLFLYSFIEKKSSTEKAVALILLLLGMVGFFISLNQIGFFDEASPFKVGLGLPTVAKFVGIPFYVYGFFLFPLGITLLFDGNVKKKISENHNKAVVTALILIGFVLAGLVLYNKTMPYFPNLIHKQGLGLKFLTGGAAESIPEIFWTALTILSVVSFFAFINIVNLKSFFTKHKWTVILFGSLFIAYATASFFTDRYILPLVVPLYLVLFSAIKNHRLFKIGLLLSIVFFGISSYFFTFEYLSWNQARNEIISGLQKQGVPKDKIDGGYEYCQATFVENEKILTINSKNVYRGICFHGCEEEGYTVAFKPLNGCSIISRQNYKGPLGLKLGELFILKK